MKYVWLFLFLCISLRAATIAELLADGYPVKSGAITPTKGGVWVANGTSFVPLAVGTDGYVLTADAASTNGIKWSASAASGGTVTSVAQSFTGGLISVGGSPITTSGTLALTVAGTSGGIPYFSSGTTWASSGALAANALVIGGGAGTAPSTITTGTGVLTALGVNTGSAGAFVVFNGAGGTPSSLTLTNASGLPISSGVSGLGTGIATALGVNVGSAGAPILFNGDAGTPSAIVLTNATGTASSLTAGTATNAVNTGITNDTTTNATMYPTWVTANTGNLPQKVSSTKLTWNPSTGTIGTTNLTASGDLSAQSGTITTTGGTIANTAGGLSVRDDIVTTAGIVKTLTDFQSTSSSSMVVKSAVTDGAGAIGIKTQTNGAFADSTSKLISVQNNSSEKAYFDLNGYLGIIGATSGSTLIRSPAIAGTGTVITMPGATGTLATLANSEAFTNKTYNGNTWTAGTGTLTIAAGKTLTANKTVTFDGADGKTISFNNTLTFAGADSTTMTFPGTSATIARTDAANTFTGASTASAWVLTSPTITTKISPTSDDGAPLGDTTHNFSDLFLATGAVINYQNGNVALTHSSGILTMGTGELRITTTGTNAASVPTLGSTNTLTNKTLTTPVIGSGLTASGSGNYDFSGASGNFLTSVGAATVNGTLTISDATTPSITTSSGKTNTGFVTVSGKISGSLKITTADATAQAVTVSAAVQTTGSTTLTIPDMAGASDTFTLNAKAQTLTNKWIQKRVGSATSSATPTINTDTTDYYRLTAQAAAITSFTTNLSGTPVAGQTLFIEVLDDGTARAITWGASFASGPATLPTTTTVNKILFVQFQWSVARTKWLCTAAGSEQNMGPIVLLWALSRLRRKWKQRQRKAA